MNVSPAALPLVPFADGAIEVRAVLPSFMVGNGIGRPAHQWDVDLAITAVTGPDLRLGDFVAITDLDVRHNVGYRRGWVTAGVIVHGGSPQPGHGPGLMPILCAPQSALDVRVDAATTRGLTLDALLGLK